MITNHHHPAEPGVSPRRWRSLARRACTLLIAGLVETSSAGGQASDPPPLPSPSAAMHGGSETTGTFDAATVEDLALFFATESVRRLRVPLLLRLLDRGPNRWSRKKEIERIRSEPPRLDANGVAYPFGDKNPLSFVFDPETRTLTCWQRIVKKRASVGRLALTGPEMAAALNSESSRDRDRGGADFAYDPIRDALSLRLHLVRPPSDRDEFYKKIDRLVAAGSKWMEKHYLAKALAIVESRRPPDSAMASRDGFTATLALRHFAAAPSESTRWVERYVRAWDRPHGGPAPMLVSDRELAIDQLLHAFVHFRGARNGPQGAAAVDATVRVVAADGSPVLSDLRVPVWRGEAPPEDHLQIGEHDISIALDRENPTGSYRIEVEVCETVAGRCVTLIHPFALVTHH